MTTAHLTVEEIDQQRRRAFEQVGYRCPKCGARLNDPTLTALPSPGILYWWGEERRDTVTCQSCGAQYPWVAGVPDFRTYPPPFQTLDEENAITDDLLEWTRRMCFPDLVSYYIKYHTKNTEYFNMIAIENRVNSQPRGERFLALYDRDCRALGLPAPTPGERDLGVMLDLGCGVCGQLVAAAPRATAMVGIDASMTEVFLGRRHLMDHHVPHGLLAMANGETLPFPDATFDRIFMRDVVEHLDNQPLGLQDAWRTLKPGGHFYFNSPNRYSVWFPEPHTALYWLGFHRRDRMRDVVWKKLKTTYDHTRLLSKWDLKTYVNQLEPHPAKKLIVGAAIPGGQIEGPHAFMAPLLQSEDFCKLPVVNWITPEHRVLLVKPAE